VVPGEPPELGPGREKIARPGQEQGAQGMKDEPLATKGKVLTPEEIREEKRAKEEKEYQKRIAQLTHQIKALEASLIKAIRGSREGGIEAGVCVTNCEEFTKAQATQLNSRLKDRLYDPARAGGSGVVTFKTHSPFGGASPKFSESRTFEVVNQIPRVTVPLPRYTEKERKFSNLNKKMGRLKEKRETLIQEMRQKNFDTGSLFLD